MKRKRNCAVLFVPSGRFGFRQIIYGLHAMANDSRAAYRRLKRPQLWVQPSLRDAENSSRRMQALKHLPKFSQSLRDEEGLSSYKKTFLLPLSPTLLNPPALLTLLPSRIRVEVRWLQTPLR